MLLALDTSASASAALVRDGEVLAQAGSTDPRRHAEVLLPLVEQVLAAAGVARADLGGVAVGVGPGPFTGLRVGMVTALVVARSLEVPVHGVCSLDALALHARRVLGADLPAHVGIATDARRREVYWATYRTGGRLARIAGPDVGAAVDVADRAEAWVGRGTRLYDLTPVAGAAGREDLLDPPAAAVGLLADAALAGRAELPLLAVEPLYLRRPDAVPAPARAPAATSS